MYTRLFELLDSMAQKGFDLDDVPVDLLDDVCLYLDALVHSDDAEWVACVVFADGLFFACVDRNDERYPVPGIDWESYMYSKCLRTSDVEWHYFLTD